MFARTERLLLRPGWGEDAPALFNAIADEAIIDKLPGTTWPYKAEDAEAFLLRDKREDDLPELLIYARTRGAPRLVGGIALREAEDEESAELDYWIARPCWGLGFATEAGQAVIGMAREGLRLKTLRSGHFPDNPASGRVLEKLGFRPTGETAKRWSAVRGQEVDCIMYEHQAA
jgi:RimJ/RimL family protein N-acetyltransferase